MTYPAYALDQCVDQVISRECENDEGGHLTAVSVLQAKAIMTAAVIIAEAIDRHTEVVKDVAEGCHKIAHEVT